MAATEDKHVKPVAEDGVKKLKEELEKTKKELDEAKQAGEEFKSKYLRALADYQNFEKRVAGQRDEITAGANRSLMLKLLPFLDHLEKAEVFMKDQGLKMIRETFEKTLAESGLEEIKVLGREYDPYEAEVIDMVEGEKDNIVVEVLRKGYMFNGRILRIAQVKVSRSVKKSN